MTESQILYCNCSYTKIIPEDVKEKVLAELTASGVEFEAVPDLCAMSASKDPALGELSASGKTKIAACFPRAVKWLFHAAGTPLPETGVEVLNMREQSAEEVVEGLLGDRSSNGHANGDANGDANGHANGDTNGHANGHVDKAKLDQRGDWKPWFPVIDYDRCTNCMQCLTFCLFDVYGVDDEKISVQNQTNCKTDCPACSRVCPEVAILFPKYKAGPINGAEVREEDLQREAMKVDISALLGGDIYDALRDRSKKARERFSTERDESKALLERKRCLKKLQKDLDIPNEVLMTLPSVGDIEDRARRAREKAERRKERSQSMKDQQRETTSEDWGI